MVQAGLIAKGAMGKSSVIGIAARYFKTLIDARTGKPSFRDVTAQIIAPAFVGVPCYFGGWELHNPSNAIVGISIVAALMCAMAALVFQIRLDLNKKLDPRVLPSNRKLVDQLFDDILWAILFGLMLALYLIIFDCAGLFVAEPPVGNILSAVAVSFAAHFAMVIGMCLKRMQRAYQIFASLEG